MKEPCSVQPNLFPFFPLIHTKKRIFANEYRLLCRICHKNNKLFLNKKLEITDEKDFGNNPPRPVA